jgi:hypothetical protein
MSAVFDRPPGPRRILAIDGGGMRGALAVGILARLEAVLRAKYGRPDMVLADYFDLIGGTSTGAIIAAGLALGRDAAAMRDLYRRLGPLVFQRGGRLRIPLIQSRFDPRNLERAIIGEVGDATLGNAAWRTGFAAVAKRVDTGSCWVLTNCPGARYWLGDPGDPRVTPNRDYPLAKIVQASAAAPFYFDMVPLEVVAGEPGVFFDGAMTPHGNPALQLAMTALIPGYGFDWQAGADRLMIVSVGTGLPRPVRPGWVRQPLLLSIWKAIHALTSLGYDNSQLATSVLQWLGQSPRPWRINSEIGDLSGARPAGEAMWTFVRYDAPLEAGWLEQHLHKSYSPAMLARLARLDDDRMVPELYALGELAGETLIDPAHFPAAFDPA